MAHRQYEKYIGQQFGRLKVLDVVRNTGKAAFYCQCECGAYCTPFAGNVTRGLTKGCGCKVMAGNTSHGQWHSREYMSWASAVQRCHNPKNKGYKNYGALGVVMCNRWRESYAAFIEDMGPRPPDTSLDRINPFGNYDPGNCRWVDRYVQANNKRKNYKPS